MHLFYDFLGPKMKSVILKQACSGFFQKIGRVATVREKSLENETFSRSGKSQGISILVREI